MSFLDKAKEQANHILNNKGESPMSNPFLNKNTVNNNAIPSIPNIPPAPKHNKMSSIPAKPGTPITIPGIPPAPKHNTIHSTIVSEVIADSPAPTNPINEEVKSEENITETSTVKDVVTEQKEKEVETKENIKEQEVTKEIKEDNKEIKEEAKEEVKEKKTTKKKGRTTKAKTTSKQEEKEDNNIESKETIEIIASHTSLSYAEACQALRTNFEDKEWNDKKLEIEDKIQNIYISNDMNKPQLHDLLAQITTLRDEIYNLYVSTKTLYEHLVDKDNGLIERVKRTSAKGSNTEERKLYSTLAVMNYTDENGNKINLYEVLDETRIRYNFLKGIIDTIEFKKMVLLTMLSSLKSN